MESFPVLSRARTEWEGAVVEREQSMAEIAGDLDAVARRLASWSGPVSVTRSAIEPIRREGPVPAPQTLGRRRQDARWRIAAAGVAALFLAAAHAARGSALMPEGELDGADAAFRRALDLDPRSVPALVRPAQLRSRQERPNEALRVLNTAAGIDGDSWLVPQELFAVRDTSNPSQQINGTTITIATAILNGVGDDHKPPVASPFSSGGRLVCMETAAGISDSGYWRVGPFPVNDVAAGTSELNFEFLVVVTAAYSDGARQQLSWDPEMDIRGSR